MDSDSDTGEEINPMEGNPSRTSRQAFKALDYAPPAPSELNSQQLPGRLWELLYAAAACGVYFQSTNHLSDREFYHWLWHQWLDTPQARLNPGNNSQIVLCDVSGGAGENWLRYYATETQRGKWMQSASALPPHEIPPYDRDRFLPQPPFFNGDTSELESGQELELLDQEDNDGIDEEEDESPFDEIDPAVPSSDMYGELMACEPENWTPIAQQLVNDGVPIIPPQEITDETVTPILWALLHKLAYYGFFLSHTDHLSDRELYCDLWTRALRELTILVPGDRRTAWFNDVLGNWGEDEVQIWLRHYASAEERREHAADFPEDPMPPMEKLPYKRDWRLPKAAFK